jgi:hypothetical protein
MRKAFQNLAEIDVSEMVISLQTCDKNEAGDGGVEGVQKSLESLTQIDMYVSKIALRRHQMSFGVGICSVRRPCQNCEIIFSRTIKKRRVSLILRSSPYATHSEWNGLMRPRKRRLRGHHKQFSVAILALYEVLKNMKIRFLRTTSKETVS